MADALKALQAATAAGTRTDGESLRVAAALGLSAAAVQEHEELGRRFLLGSSTASSSACERFAGARQGLQLWTAKAATEGGAAADGGSGGQSKKRGRFRKKAVSFAASS